MMMMMMMIMMIMMILILGDLNLKLMIICYTIKKNNIPVCVISICSVIKKENIHYPIFRLQKCFYENESFIKNINFFVYKYKRWIILLIIKRIEISY